MTKLATIVREHHAAFLRQYGSRLRRVHHRALEHILDCHTSACGEILSQCDSCHRGRVHYPSCGNRFCPSCQHGANGDWLARQQQKLLPVEYYMVTVTLPRQLRAWVWRHQTSAYKMLFDCAADTLQSFFGRDKKLLGRAGLIAVLHTHARNLDFHPHVHVIVPAGSFDKRSGLWRQKNTKYLFKANNLAKVFRGKFIAAMTATGQVVPPSTPRKWNADCQHVGRGDKALTYLARYLYRGVINERNILSHQAGNVTFRYQNSTTKRYHTLTEPAVDFLWRVVQHVLPKGFRRARDYGFLHGNAKRTLRRIQLMLKVTLAPPPVRNKAAFCCPDCGTTLTMIWHKHNKLVPLTERTYLAKDCA